MAVALQANPPTSRDTHHPQLTQRIEEASLNAWPALHQILLDGWVLRFARGFTKRSNSIVPLYATSWTETAYTSPAATRRLLAEKIRYCENLYAREQLQTVFRISSFDNISQSVELNARFDAAKAILDELLAERGYRREETSLVLSKTLDKKPDQNSIKLLPLDQWLLIYSQLTGLPEPAKSLHALILKSISGDCGFAVLEKNGQTVACGMAVIEQELVGLFDIFTHPDARGAGHGTAIVNGLCDWAANAQAKRVYLQVVEHNETALALYQQLGMREVYRYWYRVGP
jgi:GNAT superfamily N-acetyltransferase